MDRVASRRALEALRVGVVPSIAIEDLTLVRGSTVAILRSILSDDSPMESGLVIEGHYGAGKSHTLRLLQRRAIRLGFAVSAIEIDEPTRASRLDRLFGAAMTALQVGDSPGVSGIRALTKLWWDAANRRDVLVRPGRHWALAAMMEVTRRCANEELPAIDGEEIEHELWGWLTGEPVAATTIRRRLGELGIACPPRVKLYAADFTELIDITADLLVELGYSGWIVLLDEVENATRFGTSVVTRANAYRNLDELLALNSNLTTVIAVTPSAREVIEVDISNGVCTAERLKRGGTQSIELLPFGDAELLAVGDLLVRTHSKAYGWNAAGRVNEGALQLLIRRNRDGTDDSVRSYLRELVDVLDVASQHPTFSVSALRYLG